MQRLVYSTVLCCTRRKRHTTRSFVSLMYQPGAERAEVGSNGSDPGGLRRSRRDASRVSRRLWPLLPVEANTKNAGGKVGASRGERSVVFTHPRVVGGGIRRAASRKAGEEEEEHQQCEFFFFFLEENLLCVCFFFLFISLKSTRLSCVRV